MVWVLAARFTVAKRILWPWITVYSSWSYPTEGWRRTPVEVRLSGSVSLSWDLR